MLISGSVQRPRSRKFPLLMIACTWTACTLPSVQVEDKHEPFDDVGREFAAWSIPGATESAEVQPSYMASEETVYDAVTKLTWQRKVPTRYPTFCTGPISNSCNASEAHRYCETLSLEDVAEGTGWRLPTRIELASLLKEQFPRALDESVFPVTFEKAWFWTSSPGAGGDNRAWAVNFSTAESELLDAGVTWLVRCVSSPAVELPSSHYLVDADAVRDNATRLIWQREADADAMTGEQAAEYCEQLPLSGGGWRLPTYKELLTLVDLSRQKPAIDPDAFPNTIYDFEYWTSSRCAFSSQGKPSDGFYMHVDFSRGIGDCSGAGNFKRRIRCVR